VLIIDDVITAGTAIREVMQIIASQRPRPLAC
jgi:orotate phosphoribosyltransferase